LFSGSHDRTVKVWTTTQTTPLRTFSQHTETPNAVAFQPGAPVPTCATGGDGLPGPLQEATDCEAEALDFVEQAEGDSRCTYDAGQARQCLDALAGTCEERTAIYYECKRVYRGDDCPKDLSTLL
jgi:hypothetical protein